MESILSDNTKKLLDVYGKHIISDIIAKMKSMDAYNSGRLASSLNYEIQEGVAELKLLIKGEEALLAIENGRRAGKQPPLAEILRWVVINNIPKEAAYPIARKIGKFGIKPRPFLGEVVKNNTDTKLTNAIANSFAKDIEKEIEFIIKETNKTN